jgi:hypothetical protein
MSKWESNMIYTRFYDQVLTEIEAGNVHDGINLLVGMLDTVGLQTGSLAQARRELRGHSLCQMLLEDPLIADAEARPNAPAERVKMIAHTMLHNGVSSTGRRLFEATSELSFARAVRQRWGSFDLKLSRARQLGQKICVINGHSGSLLDRFDAADLSNITAIDLDDAHDTISSLAEAGHCFDLILAPDLLDQRSAIALSNILGCLRNCVCEQGSIVIAALLPQHLGTGWRSACLNWNPQCHDEQGLAKSATDAGLIARTYRDETNCVVMCELKIVPGTQHSGSATNES